MTKTLWRVYETAVNSVAIVLFTAMVIITALGVFFRYVLDAPLHWTEEADRYVFIWLTFVGASVTMRYKAHIAVDVLVRYLPSNVRVWTSLAAQVAALAFLAVVGWASLPVIEVTMETRATATDIPMGLVYLAVPVGCTLIAVETLRLIARTLRETRGETT